MLEQEGAIPKVGSMKLSKMSWHAELTGTNAGYTPKDNLAYFGLIFPLGYVRLGYRFSAMETHFMNLSMHCS